MMVAWGQSFPPARIIGPEYTDTYIYTDDQGLAHTSSILLQDVEVTSDAPRLQLVSSAGVEVNIDQKPPTWYYPLTLLGKVPKYAHLSGAASILTGSIEVFMQQIDELNDKFGEAYESLRVQDGLLRFVDIALGIFTLLHTDSRCNQLNAKIDQVVGHVNELADQMSGLKGSLEDFMFNTTAFEKDSMMRAQLSELEIEKLTNTTKAQMALITSQADQIVNITRYLKLNAESVDARINNQTQNLLNLEAQVDTRFESMDVRLKEGFAEVYGIMAAQNNHTQEMFSRMGQTIEAIRRQLYSIQTSLYDLMTDAKMRRNTADAMASVLRDVNPTIEHPLVSEDYVLSTTDDRARRTLVERFYTQFIEKGTGDNTGRRVAVQYKLEFFMDTRFAIDNAKPYDTAENMLWHMVQANCRRGVVATDSNEEIEWASMTWNNHTTPLCDMWVDIRRQECALPDDGFGGIEWSKWTFQSPTDGVKRGSVPSTCVSADSKPVFTPNANVPADFVSTVGDWRTFYQEHICHAQLLDPDYQLIMVQLGRIASIRQDLATCSMPFDEVLKLPVPGVERFIYKDLDLIPPYLIRQLDMDSEKLYGRAPALGLKVMDQSAQSIFKDKTATSVSSADMTKIRTVVWNVVSNELVPVWHYEPANPVSMEAPTLVTSVTYANGTGKDYAVVESLISSVLDVDTNVVSSLPESGTFIGDLFADTVETYDVPEDLISLVPDWRARQDKVSALLFHANYTTTPGIDEVMRINGGAYDPTRVVSLDAMRVELGRVAAPGFEMDAPYCRVKGGLPDEVIDDIVLALGDSLTSAPREVPNGKWCSLMRNFNLAMAHIPGTDDNVRVLAVSPKQWKVKVTVKMPTGVFATNLGKGACLTASLHKISDTQVGIAFSNPDEHHAVQQKVVAYNTTHPMCAVNAIFEVPKLGQFVQSLPPCDGMHVVMYRRTGPGIDDWYECARLEPGHLSDIIKTTVPVPPDVQYAIKVETNTAFIQLANAAKAGVQASIMNARSLAINVNASAEIRQRIEDAARRADSYSYQSGNWTQLDPVNNEVKSILDDLQKQAEEQQRKAHEAQIETEKRFADQDAMKAQLAAITASQNSIIAAQTADAQKLRNSTWFQYWVPSASGGDDAFAIIGKALEEAWKATKNAASDIADIPKSIFGSFGSVLNDIIAIAFPILCIILFVAFFPQIVQFFKSCCSHGGGDVAIKLVGAAAQASGGAPRRRGRRGNKRPRGETEEEEQELVVM